MNSMKVNVDPQKIVVARRLAILAVIVWFATAVIASITGIINEPDRPPLVLGTFILLPIAGFVAAYFLSASFRAFTESMSLTLIVASHLWRFVGVGFMIAWLTGALPAGFGIPEGFGDIIAAIGALVLVPKLRKGTAPRTWLFAWNTFGLIDLISAIVVGILYSDSTLGILSKDTVNTKLMVTFPVSLIPSFFVPLFILLHILTFKKIADFSESKEVRIL